MEAIDLIGWAASGILVLTIANQVWKQWKSGTSAGVSRFLFVGQVTASILFTTYSWLVHNWVFVVTNALMLVNAIVGLGITRLHKRRAKQVPEAPPATQAAPGLVRNPA